MLTILLAAVLSAPPEPKTITADDWLTEAGKMLEKAASIKDKAKREKLARAELAKFNAKHAKHIVVAKFKITGVSNLGAAVSAEGTKGTWMRTMLRVWFANGARLEVGDTVVLKGPAQLVPGDKQEVAGWFAVEEIPMSINFSSHAVYIERP